MEQQRLMSFRLGYFQICHRYTTCEKKNEMHVHFSFEHDTGRNDAGYRTYYSNLTGNCELQRLLLDG